MAKTKLPDIIYCSFCYGTFPDVKKLLRSKFDNSKYICDGCIRKQFRYLKIEGIVK